jgi:TonB-dependent receptor
MVFAAAEPPWLSSPGVFRPAMKKSVICGLACLSLAGAFAPSPTAAQESAVPPPEPMVATGTVSGRVYDELTGQPVYAAQVGAEGLERKATTDVGGRFRLDGVPVGARTLRLKKDGYLDLEVTAVEVRAAQTSPIEVMMRPATGEVVVLGEMRIEASVVQNSGVGLNALRRSTNIAVDAMSAEDIGRYVSTDIADVFVRLPGASVSRGKFAVIRGLAERYNPVMLDGVVLPSADPERQTPKLDLFPTRLIDGIVVSKTFSPELPTFATGGSVNLLTMPFPDQAFTEVQFGVRVDEGAWRGDPFLDYATGGSGDRWARGRSDRERYVPLGETGQIEAPLTLTPRMRRVPLGWKGSLSHGNTLVRWDGAQRWGYNLIASYDSSYGTREGVVTGFRARPNQPDFERGILPLPDDGNVYFASDEEVLVGLTVVGGYAVGVHELVVRAFLSQTSQDTTQLTDEIRRGAANLNFEEVRIFEYELDYRERRLTNLGISGKHGLWPDRGIQLRWGLDWIQALEDQPDLRSTRFLLERATGRLFLSQAESNQTINRFWRETEEATWSGHVDLRWPLTRRGAEGITLDGGLGVERTERTYFEADNSGFPLPATAVTINVPSEIETLIVGTLRRSALFTAAEATRRADLAHLALQIPWTRSLRTTLGARYERLGLESTGSGRLGNLTSTDFYRFSPAQAPLFFPGIDADSPATSVQRNAFHPAALVTWSPWSRLNVRAAWSRTVARPSFRELGSYFTRNLQDGVLIHGNATLRPTPVENFDLRFEWFFPGTDLVALSLFRKHIENPIERARIPFVAGKTDTWVNNPGEAKVSGVEVELRRNLGFLGERWSGWSVGANGTYIDAEVPRLPGELLALRNGFSDPSLAPVMRRLYDQPEWLFNADLSLDWSRLGHRATLAWLASSDVLYASSSFAQLNLHTDAFSQLDLTISQRLPFGWSLKVSAKNLTDSPRRVVYDPSLTAEPIIYTEYRDGRSYSFTFSRTF